MQKPLFLCLFWVSLALLGSGCAPGTPAPDRQMSPAQAIEAAVTRAASSAPEISGSQVPPTNVRAQKMTLGDAWQHKPAASSLPAGRTATAPVWLVTMDGLWLNEVSVPNAPPGFPTQVPYRHYGFILDAVTGEEISGWASP